MSIKERIKAMVREAEIYRSQSLLDQSKEKYHDLLKLVENDESTSKNKKLINDIKNRIKAVDDEITEIDQAQETPELSSDVQNILVWLCCHRRSIKVNEFIEISDNTQVELIKTIEALKPYRLIARTKDQGKDLISFVNAYIAN